MESNQNSTASKVCFIGKGKLTIFQNNESIDLGNVVDLSICFDKSIEKIRDVCNTYNDCISTVVESSISFNNFNNELKLFLSNQYLLSHSKLPGSTRTKRLRKKQISVLMNWWCKIDECNI